MLYTKLPQHPKQRVAYQKLAKLIHSRLRNAGVDTYPNRKCCINAICNIILTLDTTRYKRYGVDRFSRESMYGHQCHDDNLLIHTVMATTYMKYFTSNEIGSMYDCYNYLTGMVGA